MENNFTPLFNNILIKPAEVTTILRSTEGTLCEYGEVMAIGEAVEHVKVGDTIGFTKWGVKELNKDGQKHYIIPEDGRFLLGRFN